MDKSVSGEFPYSAENDLEFEDDELLPKGFSNLKRTFCRHISSSKSHTDALKDRDKKEKDAK